MMTNMSSSLSSLGSDGNTSFLRAARAGHLDKVLEHLKQNIDINTSNANGLNALHLASKDGHVQVVEELLKRGASVDAATKKGNTALHIASLAGQEEVVKLLVQHGASVNVQSQNGFTPLYMAAQENHDNVVKYLLANGANQSLATEDGFTPLAVAMQQGHDKVVTVLLENDTRGKVRLPALHIAAKKDDVKAAKLLLENEHNPDVTSKSGFTPLHIASHYGNESIANLLIQKGADVNYAAKHNISPLHVAAKWGKTNMVALLLDKGANIESKTRDGLTPLHCAARSGHEQVVDMLLERGAPISSKTKNGLAPLHMAAQGDHVDAARILLYHRAPVDEVTVDYLTALHVAAHCGHARVAKLLLDRGADANARALNGFTPLHIACKKNRIKVVELLLKHGASIGATTESGLTPLHVASFMGCMNIVIYLLQHEANPDVPTVRGETPLHLAARANQTDIIRILLRNGANVDARAREQQTPLHIASRLGNVDIVMLLLQHGAKVDTTTKDMYTALHIAAKEGQDEVATALIDNGASLNATTKKGFTPLHLAAKYGNIKVAKLLLQKEAPVDAQGKNGVTPLHVASHYDHQNVALLLLDKGASPHATAKNGHTPLHIAARKNQMDIANTLLEYGAQPNAESKAGFTPLHLSSQEGHTDMSSLLIEHQADTNHQAKNGLTPLHLCAQEDRVPVADILLKNGAEIDAQTKGGYTPLHVASHYGQSNMVKFLLANGANVKSTTSIGYTPLHQAAQQGHTNIVNVLLENSAHPNAVTMNGQTPLSIAQKLGYISVIETLKVVTETTVTTTTVTTTEEKYRVVAPEAMQETFMSDSEEEGGEDTLLGDQTYRYLTADEMKSLGDDSLPIDVTKDERMDSNRMVTSGDSNILPPQAIEDSISPQHIQQNYIEYARKYAPDNVDIARHPISIGFLVSFLVDARGGAMRGCRHSGVRVIVPPRCAPSPTRITCRYVRPQRTPHPPPLMEGEALASRILELGPVGVKFLGPVIIEVPHFAALRGKEREIVILRSDNGETWREHTVDSSEEILNDVLHDSFEADELNQLEDPASGRITRIVTNDFPQYFAVVSRVRQEVHAIGPEGGMVSSTVVPQVQAVFPQGALTKKIKVGLQAQPIDPEITAKLLGHGVAVSPVVTVEPRRRKFHKAITLSMPAPTAHSQGMINQYSGSAPTLRLLCSITGGTTRAQWEDVTGSTPLTFVNDCVSFTTTVSARFWLMDCRNIGDATKMATELYKEAIHVPFMAKFVVFAKRVDPLEARLRVFCMTDDKEDKTLEHQEHFTEVAKSRDVEVLEGKPQYIEFAGNLVPVTKSGEQLQFSFRAFRENRLPFSVRVKDQHAEAVGRCLFMKEAKVPKGEPPQQPICILNIVLPDDIISETISLTDSESWKRPGFLKDSYEYYRPDPRLADMSNLLGEDWVPLANQLGLTTSEINVIKSEYPDSVAKQAQSMLRMWIAQSGNRAQGNVLENALIRVGREDIIPQCLNVEPVEHVHKREGISRVSKDYYDKDRFIDAEDHVETRERYEDKYSAEEKIVDEISDEEENFKKTVSERRNLIEKRLSAERAIPASSQRVEIVQEISTIKRQSLVEDKIAEVEEKQKTLQEPTKTTTTKTTTSPDGRTVTETVEMKTTILDAQQLQMDQFFAAQPDITTVTTTITEVRTTEFIPDTELPTHKVEVSAGRRDSDLLEGVTQRLETTKKSVPRISSEDPNSPMFSKTPPPSPADFIIREQAAAVQEWDASGKPSVEGPVARGTPAVDAVQKDASYGLTQTSAELTTSESHLTTAIPKPKPRVTKSTDADIPRDSQKSPVRDDVLDTDLSQDITTTIEEESKTYTDKKKFWETISSDSESKVTKLMSLHEELSLEKPSVAKKRTSLHEVPPVPKPRSAVQLSESVEETTVKKDQRVSFDSTASDSSGLHHTEVTKISGSDASFDEVPTKVMSEYQAQFQDPAALPKSILKTTEAEIRIDTQSRDSFDSEKGYGAQEQGYISDSEDVEHYISDSEIEDRVPQIRTRQMSVFQPAVPARKSIYERSFSLPTEDLYDISASMRLRKQYFEEQLRKEMVEEQFTTELEEETSPEHKTLSSLQVLDEEPTGTRSAPEEVDETKFDATVKSVKDLARAFDSSPKLSEQKKKPRSVKELAKGFETETGSVIIRQKVKSPKDKYDEEDDKTKSFQDIKTMFDTTEIHKQEVTSHKFSPDELDKITHKPEITKTHKEDKQKLAEEYAERFMMEQKEFSRETRKQEHELEVTTSETSYSREETHKPVMTTAYGDESVDDIKATPESKIMEQETHKPDATLTHKPESQVAVPPKDYQTHKEAQLESQTKRSSTESEKSSSPERSLELVEGLSGHEVALTKDDSISRPSDSMEVHVDKSEVEDSEKITDNEQDATDIETKSLDSLNAVEVVSKTPLSADDQIPEITVTLSGKQRRISETSEESLDEGQQDIRAISPIAEKPEITSPVHQPEVHVEDTVWEVSVQSQPSFEKTIDLPMEKEIKVEKDEELSGSARDESELGSEIHQDHSESLASDRVKSECHSEIEQIILESLQHQNISPDEARKIAAELVEDIETEIHKRQQHMGTGSDEPCVPTPELARNQVSEYLRQLAETKGLDSREVQLVESVLARKQRFAKLKRDDTQASSMEITDEDLKFSGTETDYSPSASQAHILEQLEAEKMDIEGVFDSMKKEYEDRLSTTDKVDEHHTDETSISKSSTTYEEGKLIGIKSDIHTKTMEGVKSGKSKKDTIVEEDEGTTEVTSQKSEFTGTKKETLVKQADEKIADDFSIKKESTSVTLEQDDHKLDTMTKISDAITDSGKVEKMLTKKTEEDATKVLGKYETEVKSHEIDDSRKTDTCEKEKHLTEGIVKKEMESTHDDIKQSTFTTDGSKLETSEVIDKSHTKISSSSVLVDEVHTESIITKTELIDDLNPEDIQKLIEDKEITITTHEEIKRTLSDESKSSQDESIKSPEEQFSTCSSGRKGDSDTVSKPAEKHDVILRKTKTHKDADTSSSSGNLKPDRKSGVDFEAYSSSGESHYHSFELDSGKSRPCSSDVEGLLAAGSSEYESALTSQDISGRSHHISEYHTAASSLSSKESMKSLDSESSGNLASVEVSEVSETLVASELEFQGDEDEVARDDGIWPDRPTRQGTQLSDSDMLTYPDIEGSMDVSEDEFSNEPKPIEEIPSKMKRSHEMTFQPEPKVLVPESPQSETGQEGDEKFGSVDEGSVLSMSLSSTSSVAALRTVIELSRADSERQEGSMNISVTSEQLSLDDMENLPRGSRESLVGSHLLQFDASTPTPTATTDSATSTHPPVLDLPVGSVTITSSIIAENGIQSVSTQVTSRSHTPTSQEEFDITQPNGPTEVDYVPEYDDVVEPKKKGHRRHESTSSFVPPPVSIPTTTTRTELERKLHSDLAESDKYTTELSFKEVRSDEKKDIDETEREESYETEADQGFHRDMRESRFLDTESDQDNDLETKDLSRPHSQVSKTDSELVELAKQSSSEAVTDPIERPVSPEPCDECEIKDDTPEFSSEAQASVGELEQEYSSAVARTHEVHVTDTKKVSSKEDKLPHKDILEKRDSHGRTSGSSSEKSSFEEAEAEAAFSMVAHISPAHKVKQICPILEDEDAEKHELETRERAQKELEERRAQMRDVSPSAIPDIKVTQHMTPLIDRGFHYPDLELEEQEAETQKSTPETPASNSSKTSEETDQGKEYVLDDGGVSIPEEPESGVLDEKSEKALTESKSEVVSVVEKTIRETGKEAESPTESPNSDSFEMLEKPDLMDDFVIIEEVAKEAFEQDTEGKSMRISSGKKPGKKHDEEVEEYLIKSSTSPKTKMTELKYYPDGSSSDELGFEFEDSPPTANQKNAGVTAKEGSGSSPRDYVYEYDRELEANKKWIEQQFQGDQAILMAAGYGYEMEFERAPLEDIKEEEVTDFDPTSSRIGSLGSQKESGGSLGSVKDSFSSTPEYDVLAGRKYFTRSGEHDDVSMSSLQEFENLERAMSLENRRCHQGSQDSSSNGSFGKRYYASRSGQGDDVSVSSLKEFEGLEKACIAVHKIEQKVKEEEAMLAQIDEGQESIASESESCETMSGTDKKLIPDSDEEDYEKRMFEIDEIIRQAQSNVEKFIDIKEDDKPESIGRGDSLEEVSKVPDLDFDAPLTKTGSTKVQWATTDDIMATSTDSLDLKPDKPSRHDSTDSLDQKTTAADIMTASTDSIEFQMQQKSAKETIMTDSIEFKDIPDQSYMMTSSDSLELATGTGAQVAALLSDSIDEDGSRIGFHDHSSSSTGKDFSSSVKEDQEQYDIREQLGFEGQDPLDVSSSTATHATCHYETDSVFSGSFTSGGSNTMVSSTDTIDPTGSHVREAVDLAAAVRKVWFDDDSEAAGKRFTTEYIDDTSKPYVTEVIEPCEEDDTYSHTIHRRVELPPEIRKVTFRGPDADQQLRQYIQEFGEGEDVQESEEVDADGNVHVKRVVQKRFVVKSEDKIDEQPSDPQQSQQIGQKSKEWEGQGVIKRTYTDGQGTKTIYTQQFGLKQMESQDSTSAVHSLLSSIAGDTAGEGSGTWQAAPESVLPRPPAAFKAQASRRRPLRYEISVDDQIEVDPREHDWRFNLPQYAGHEEGTSEGPAQGPSSQPGTQPRSVADQHQLSEEMKELLREMEEDSKK